MKMDNRQRIRYYQKIINRLRGEEEKIGFLDIEASNLHADFGIVYTYCILPLENNKIIKRWVTVEDLKKGYQDKRLLQQFVKDIQKFNRIVVQYGSDNKFDIPFLRTRCVKWGIHFPEYGFHYISDTYNILKAKFRLHSNRLESACKLFNIPAKEHKLDPTIWSEMISCNQKRIKKAIKYILQHNIEDVYSLRALYKKIWRYARNPKRSI